ncbi:MAG: hypothetical protein E3J72_15605 [Planctomycetota bacterium]|nr:MAG: hypothetical protein E3J72_15605 [Planctomycetota bacterium]
MSRIVFTIIIILLIAPQVFSEEQNINTIEVLTAGQLTIRLLVKKKANLSDENWLQIEFENKGETPINIQHASYWIGSKRFNLKTGKQVTTGNLGTGSTFDFFPHCWDQDKAADRIINKGKYRASQQISDRSALALPPKEGLLVKADLHIWLELKNGTEIKTPGKGTSFEFEWHYPDEQGFAKMKRRFKHILKNPLRWQHSCILYAYFKIPEVAGSVTVDDLLDALRVRENCVDRQGTMRFINEHHPGDEKVIRFFMEGLEKLDSDIARTLYGRGSKIWHSDFVKPLLKIYEKRSDPWVLRLLHRHCDDWPEDLNVAEKLSGIIIGKRKCLTKKPQELDEKELRGWASAARSLGHSSDPKVIKYLTPFLKSKVLLYEPRFFGLLLGERLPALRACDVAMEVIFMIRKEDIDKAYKEAGYDHVKIMKDYRSDYKKAFIEMNRIRDKMIGNLLKNLQE